MRRGGRKIRHYQSLTETAVVLVFLCFLFFGLLQICRWAMSRMLMEYSSYQVAAGFGLGYTEAFNNRIGRAAAIGASGRDQSSPRLAADASQHELGERIESFISNPAASGVDFQYWGGSSPIYVSASEGGGRNATVTGIARLSGMPLLHPGLEVLLKDAAPGGYPEGRTVFYNYSRHYLVNP